MILIWSISKFLTHTMSLFFSFLWVSFDNTEKIIWKLQSSTLHTFEDISWTPSMFLQNLVFNFFINIMSAVVIFMVWPEVLSIWFWEIVRWDYHDFNRQLFQKRWFSNELKPKSIEIWGYFGLDSFFTMIVIITIETLAKLACPSFCQKLLCHL